MARWDQRQAFDLIKTLLLSWYHLSTFQFVRGIVPNMIIALQHFAQNARFKLC